MKKQVDCLFPRNHAVIKKGNLKEDLDRKLKAHYKKQRNLQADIEPRTTMPTLFEIIHPIFVTSTGVVVSN